MKVKVIMTIKSRTTTTAPEIKGGIFMALTAQQLNDDVYLTNMIQNLQRQREQSLRQNEMRKQQDIRQLRQLNQRNGINGGFEESNYARLLARAGQGADSINAQYNPQIAEYQGYLDAWRQRQNAGSGTGGSGSGSRRSSSSDLYTNEFTKYIGRGRSRNYTGSGNRNSAGRIIYTTNINQAR